VRPGSKIKLGNELIFRSISCKVVEHCEDSSRVLDFHGAADEEIKEAGLLAIPPYIHKYPDNPESYQTVYSQREGSVAAPTAGLHFTDELLGSIESKGVAIEYITLHVGIGTFRPVKSEVLNEHKMHSEYFTVSSETAKTINDARAERRRIVAVGTTTVRTLESIATRHGELVGDSGQTDIFIFPPYRFRIIDSLVTNFHLPKSTLLMLVAAFAGRELIFSAYKQAISMKYRFFSFGDACFIM
jgi:S-adenosylmethionine:tRNA ribosyltransferase-isomerase